MRILDKSAYLGGINSISFQKTENCSGCKANISCKYCKFITRLENAFKTIREDWEKTKKSFLSIKDNLINHLSAKQEIYWPLLISAILLMLVFLSQITFAKTIDSPNNLPIKDHYKVRLIAAPEKNQNAKICSADNKKYQEELARQKTKNNQDDLKEDIAKVVKNTPMSAMVEAISEKPRPVAAFLVGIAMKESKFGVYSPKIGRRDCYNYWGFKGGGKTVAGGYSCFNSPEQAVEAVSGRIEKMVAKGIRTPAQAVSWKCGISCAGHDPSGVRKWISDVAIYFNKINS